MKNIDAFELFDCFVVGILVGDEQMHNTILLLVSKMCDAIQYNHCHVCLVFLCVFAALRQSQTSLPLLIISTDYVRENGMFLVFVLYKNIKKISKSIMVDEKIVLFFYPSCTLTRI